MPLKTRNNKGFDRLSNAANIFIKYGFQNFIVNTGILKGKVWQKKFPEIDPTLTFWQRIRLLTQDLGPTAVKLAKFLSSKPDILPDELITEFNNLEFNKFALAKSTAINIFEQYTRRSAEKTFQYFDNYCYLQDGFTATFRAKMLTGEDVAVKILPPDTQSEVIADIALIKRIAKFGSAILQRHGINNPMEILADFEHTILPELDLSTEADKIKRFSKAFQKVNNFVIPEIYHQFVSTNTLVTSYYNSTSVTDAKEFTAWGLQQKAVADRFLSIFISGMLDTGLFLTSPLKEIVRILPDGRIHFADYGTADLLTTDQRAWIHDVIAALTTRNSRILADSMRKLANNSEVFDFQLFRNDIQYLADNIYFLESSDHYMREFSLGIMRIAYKHKLVIPREVISAFGSLSIAESIALSITPTCKISDFFKAYGHKLQLERMQPDRLKSMFNKNMSQMSDFLETSPLELSLILKKMRRGEFLTNVNLYDFKLFMRRIDVSVNKFCYIMIICAILMASTLILVFGHDMYMIFGMPLPSVVGFGLCILIALSLLIYNARTRFRPDSQPSDDDNYEN